MNVSHIIHSHIIFKKYKSWLPIFTLDKEVSLQNVARPTFYVFV